MTIEQCTVQELWPNFFHPADMEMQVATPGCTTARKTMNNLIEHLHLYGSDDTIETS